MTSEVMQRRHPSRVLMKHGSNFLTGAQNNLSHQVTGKSSQSIRSGSRQQVAHGRYFYLPREVTCFWLEHLGGIKQSDKLIKRDQKEQRSGGAKCGAVTGHRPDRERGGGAVPVWPSCDGYKTQVVNLCKAPFKPPPPPPLALSEREKKAKATMAAPLLQPDSHLNTAPSPPLHNCSVLK